MKGKLPYILADRLASFWNLILSSVEGEREGGINEFSVKIKDNEGVSRMGPGIQ